MFITRLAPGVRLASPPAAQETARLAYVDNLRLAVITVVIVHHAAQAYGNAGSGWAIPDPAQSAILRPFLAVNAAFGMGLMFLLAGYFTPRAYAHHGPRELMRERLVRLGTPTLIVAFGLFMPYTYLSQPPGLPFGAFLLTYLPEPQVGHMWFASLLIICDLGYVAWRALAPPTDAPQPAPPGHLAILGFALWLGAASFLVRLIYPLDRWVSPAPFIWFEPAHLPQYLGLFALGCAAARGDWLARLPARTGETWLGVGLGAAALPYLAALLGERLPPALRLLPRSGAGPEAIIWLAVETLICVGLSVGLVTFFRERVNRRSALIRRLSAASYTVYLIHLLPVLGLQLALSGAALPALLKFLIVSVAAVPASFAIAVGLRRAPLLGRVLG